MDLRFSQVFFLLMLVVFTVLSTDLSVASGTSASVTTAKIQEYVTKIIDAGAPKKTDRQKILKKYTDNMEKKDGIPFTAVAKVHISLAESSLSYEAPCDPANQEKVDSFIRKKTDDNFLDTYKFYHALSQDGKQYCNFVKYLMCSDDPGTLGTHKCLCPSSMVWQSGKCVFKLGAKCDDRWREEELAGSRFINWDFIHGRYTQEITPICEGASICTPGTDVCRVPGRSSGGGTFKQYATVQQLKDFFHTHSYDHEQYYDEEDPDPGHGSVRNLYQQRFLDDRLFKEIHQPQRADDYYFLSLEVLMEKRLLEHGMTCDYANDKILNDYMKSYNRRDNEHFKNVGGNDDKRREFQILVLDSGKNACNHFKFFHCTSSGTCGCKDNLEFDKSTGYCSKPYTTSCDWNGGYEMKLFEFKYDSSSFVGVINERYFVIWKLNCASSTSCKTFAFANPLCVKYEDTANIRNLQLDFDKKFSIPAGGACNADDHKELFKLGKNSGSLSDFQKILEGLVSKSSVQYCKIRQRATCSMGGTCTCVSPAVPEFGDCVLPLNVDCKFRESGGQLDDHKTLDNLVLPHETNKEIQRIFCTFGAACEYRYDVPGFPNLCSICKGTNCEGSKTNQHADHIDMNHLNLPASMQTDEGRKLIWELHRALYKVEDSMTLQFGQRCDSSAHSQLESVMSFLTKLRTDCGCQWERDHRGERWACQNREVCANGTDFEKPKWNDLLRRTEALISKRLCKWNLGKRCIAGTCLCSEGEDSFFENGQCYVDLGGECKHVIYQTDVHSTLCRDDLFCSPNKICRLEFYYVYPEDPNIKGVAFVSAQKEKLLKFHIQDKLVRSQTLTPGDPCHHTEEVVLRDMLIKVGPASDYAKTSGNIQEERQKVRLLIPIVEEVDKIRKSGTSFCKPPSTCDPMKNECTGSEGDEKTTRNPIPGLSGRGFAVRLRTKVFVFFGLGILLIQQ